MENFNKLIPIDGENGEKRTISSLQIAEITGKAYCGVLKVIRKMDIMRVKITMKNIFSLFVCLKKCCNFAVRQFYYHIRIGDFLCPILSSWENGIESRAWIERLLCFSLAVVLFFVFLFAKERSNIYLCGSV